MLESKLKLNKATWTSKSLLLPSSLFTFKWSVIKEEQEKENNFQFKGFKIFTKLKDDKDQTENFLILSAATTTWKIMK